MQDQVLQGLCKFLFMAYFTCWEVIEHLVDGAFHEPSPAAGT